VAGFGHCHAIPPAGLSVTASFAPCSPTLFHQSHFDWETGRFSGAGSGLCRAISQSAPSVTPSTAGCSPTLFHQSHYDWEKDAFRRRVRTLQGDSAGRAVSNAFVRRVLANFISPITL